MWYQVVIAFILSLLTGYIFFRTIKKSIARRRRNREEHLAALQQLQRESDYINLSTRSPGRLTDLGAKTLDKTIGDDMITITETARVQATPDTVLATLGLTARAKSYEQCRAGLDRDSSKLITTIQALSLSKIETSSGDFRIFPDYDNDKKWFGKSFHGSHTLVFKFQYTDQNLRSFYEQLSLMNGDISLDLTFLLEDIADAKKEALEKAINATRVTANQIAAAASIELDRIVAMKPKIVVGSPHERQFGGTEYIMREATLRAAIDGSIEGDQSSIQAGELEVVAMVTTKYRIKPSK